MAGLEQEAPSSEEGVAVGARDGLGPWMALAYFGLYLGYLFLRPESEALHWISMVLIPLALVWWLGHRGRGGLRTALESFGLGRERWARWVPQAVLLGLALSVLQLVLSRTGGEILETIRSGRALWLFPLSFLLMLLTAGFTEEFFFRGFLQGRLEALLGSRIGALVAASVLFGLYHLPYAFLNPHWPSAGDWPAAWGAALGQGIPGGLILGWVYLRSEKNLVACAVVHALINALPAMALIRFGP